MPQESSWRMDSLSRGSRVLVAGLLRIKKLCVKDIFVARVDGLMCFLGGIETFFLETVKDIATDMKPIYSASTLEDAEYQLGRFEQNWNASHPLLSES